MVNKWYYNLTGRWIICATVLNGTPCDYLRWLIVLTGLSQGEPGYLVKCYFGCVLRVFLKEINI